MLSEERRNEILEFINRDKVIKIKDIIERYGISVATARRDLDILEEQLFAKRIYGGAVALTPSGTEPLYMTRAVEYRDEKIAIGKAAAALVNDGDTVLLDIGTTTLEVARNLKKRKDLTVLTSSVPIILELGNSTVAVYCLGGRVRAHELSMSGSISLNALERFHVQKAFIGAAGATLEEGISDFNYEEAQVRVLAIQRAKEAILVMDSSKFGINAFAAVCPLGAFHTVVTDSGVPKSYAEGIRDRKIKLIAVPTEMTP